MVGSSLRLVARCLGPVYPLSAMVSRRSLRGRFSLGSFGRLLLGSFPSCARAACWIGVIGHLLVSSSIRALYEVCMALVTTGRIGEMGDPSDSHGSPLSESFSDHEECHDTGLAGIMISALNRN